MFAKLMWVLFGLMLALLAYSGLLFLLTGWSTNRSTVLCRFTPGLIRDYFGFFPSPASSQLKADATDAERRKVFRKLYDSYLGVPQFLVPMALYWVSAGLLLLWSFVTVMQWVSEPQAVPASWHWLAIAAIVGAYMRTVYDQITAALANDMSPGDLLWATFRLVLAVPIAFSLTAMIKEPGGVALAFLIGFFPTRWLFTAVQRLTVKKLDLGDAPSGGFSEIHLKLQGVDQSKAEQFAEEGVTTVLQLAYYDPIRLSIRTGLDFNYVVDCISQSLLCIYFDDHLAKLRRYGIRGAQEALNFWDWTNDTDPARLAEAKAAEASAAKEIGMDVIAFRAAISEVAEDPFTIFLHNMWSEMCPTPTAHEDVQLPTNEEDPAAVV